MNVLVTGAKGFIGRNLVHKLNLADSNLKIVSATSALLPEELDSYRFS